MNAARERNDDDSHRNEETAAAAAAAAREEEEDAGKVAGRIAGRKSRPGRDLIAARLMAAGRGSSGRMAAPFRST